MVKGILRLVFLAFANAVNVRIIRMGMLTVVHQDFIRQWDRFLVKHVLQTAFIPTKHHFRDATGIPLKGHRDVEQLCGSPTTRKSMICAI